MSNVTTLLTIDETIGYFNRDVDQRIAINHPELSFKAATEKDDDSVVEICRLVRVYTLELLEHFKANNINYPEEAQVTVNQMLSLEQDAKDYIEFMKAA